MHFFRRFVRQFKPPLLRCQGTLQRVELEIVKLDGAIRGNQRNITSGWFMAGNTKLHYHLVLFRGDVQFAFDCTSPASVGYFGQIFGDLFYDLMNLLSLFG